MKIALIGYGKMGKLIEHIAVQRGHTISVTIDMGEEYKFESDAFRSSDVAIEFTAPASAIVNYRRCWQKGVAVVSGTTGWTSQLDEIRNEVMTQGNTLFWSSNFSVGVYLFNKVNIFLAQLMRNQSQYDVSLKEIHHTQKKDAPSGTAITIAENINAVLGRYSRWQLVDSVNNELKEGAVADSGGEERKCCNDFLPIEAQRIGNVAGIHTVKYSSEDDYIELTHHANSRSGFAFGAVLAAEYTINHRGWLTMDDMMDSNNFFNAQ